MNIIGNKIHLGIAAILFIVFFTSCNKDDGESSQTDLDVNGFWIVVDESTGNCGGDLETDYNTVIYSVEQSGASLKITVYPNEDIIYGQLNGNNLTWSGTLPTISGNLDIDFNGTVNSGGNTINGEGEWEWYNDSYSCTGISTISGNKVEEADMDFSGDWNGFWDSEEYGMGGTFSANVSQDGNSLNGTISVSEIGMENVALAGMVHGNVVYFGDVEGVIKFAGTIDEDHATGAYSYNSLSDEGSWSAFRGIY